MMTMSVPSLSKNACENIMEMEFDELTEQFQEDVELIQFKMFKQTPVKKIQARSLNGPLYVDLLVHFVEVLNKQGVPNVSNVWDIVMANQTNF